MEMNDNLDNNIMQVETMLEEIFGRYTNDDFEYLQPVAFVYKRSIRFVPVELKNQVESLIELLNKMEESKAKKLTKTM